MLVSERVGRNEVLTMRLVGLMATWSVVGVSVGLRTKMVDVETWAVRFS